MLIPLHLIVRELCWHPDLDNTIKLWNVDNTIKLWNVESRTEVANLKGHSNWVYSVAFNKEGTLLASGSADRTIKLKFLNDLTRKNIVINL